MTEFIHWCKSISSSGLGPFVRGLVTTASTEFFRTEVIVNQISATDDGNIVFEVINKSIDPNSDAFEKVKTPFTDSSLSTSPGSLFFSVETLCEAFPFHFIFKRNFRIIEMGNSLKRFVMKDSIVVNKANKIMFSDMFIITKPIIELNFETILVFSNHLFLLTAREEYVKDKKKSNSANKIRSYSLSPERTVAHPRLLLKGQMISLPAFDSILFLGSPKIEEIEEMIQLDLTITDFPVYEANGRHIMSRAIRNNDQDVINKIDKAANHLKIVEKKLRFVQS